MTPKQKQWTEKQITLIIDPIKRVGPLSMTDEQWEAVNNRIDHVIRLRRATKKCGKRFLTPLNHMIKWLIPANEKEESTVCGLFFLKTKKHTL